MTDDMMNLRSLVEKSADADLLRHMIGFAAEKLMALEVGAATGAGYGEKSALRTASATAIAIEIGKRGLVRLNYVSRSCGPAAISRASLNPVAWPKRL
jgi:hypothetical protein